MLNNAAGVARGPSSVAQLDLSDQHLAVGKYRDGSDFLAVGEFDDGPDRSRGHAALRSDITWIKRSELNCGSGCAAGSERD